MAAHFYKDRAIKGDRIIYTYVLMVDGKKVGEVKTKKEANAWWKRVQECTR